MNDQQDTRWIQRFSNYSKALTQLNDAVELSHTRTLSLLEKQGLIQAFEFTHELAWNLLKDYLEYQGNQDIRGSRDAFREAFKVGLIQQGDVWMETVKARNITSHTYDENIVQRAFIAITHDYVILFNQLHAEFEKIKIKEQSS